MASQQHPFVDDDTEILSMLLSSAAGDVEDLNLVLNRLQADHAASLMTTILKDHDTTTTTSIVASVNAAGFPLCYEYGKEEDTTTTTTTADSTVAVAAFADDTGQQHIRAVMALLHVSKRTATALTLGVLMVKSSSSNQEWTSDTNSMIGTIELLSAVTEYYYSQRAARLSILAELLRIHSNNNNSNNQNADEDILDELDSAVTMNEDYGVKRKRGLFCLLLAAACQAGPEWSRNDYLPAQELCSTEAAWKTFLRESTERIQVLVTTERVEAMEALCALLFHRLSCVQRTDLAVLVTCLARQHFFCNINNNHRLSKLAGLVCTESMALWRIFSREKSNDDNDHDDAGGSENNPNNNINNNTAITEVDWTTQHPFFQGETAVPELRALAKLLQGVATDVDRRWSNLPQQQAVEAPEALALLSFGLLLNAAGKTPNKDWKDLGATGFELAKLANDAYDAFGYLQTVMDTMVLPSPTTTESSVADKLLQNLPYDFMIDAQQVQLLEEEQDDSSDNELSAPSLTYASIGRELLTASIYAFQDSVLPASKLPLPENVGKLSNLVVAIFRNSPTLCERFWADWEIYTSTTTLPTQVQRPLPLCRLLQGAHRLAVAALRVVKGQFSDTDVLQGITPLFQLVSSFAYSADIAEEELVAILPSDLIRRAILILNSRSIPSDSLEVFADCRVKVLRCIAVLAKIGNTHSVRKLLRAELEDKNTKDIEGPRTLANIVTASKDRVTIATVFSILADLMEGAPFEWIFDVVRALKLVQDEETVWRSLFTQGCNDCIQAMVQVVNGLVTHLNKLVFSPVLDDNTIIEILSVVKIGVLTSSELLSISLSTTPGKKPITYTSAKLILDCLTNALKQLRPISELHKWRRVQGAAMDFLDYLISVLAASHGLGEAIFFYATAPVSLSLSTSLDSALQNSNLHKTESNNDNVSMFPSYQGRNSANAENRARLLLLDKLADVESFVLELEDLQARGWLGAEDDIEAPLRASISAFRLLNWWAKTIEIKIPQDSRIGPYDTSQQIPSEGMSDMLGLSPYRLLGYPANLPLRVRSDSLLSSVWKATGVSTVSLLLKLLQTNEEETDMGGSLTVEVLDFVSVSLAHEKIAMVVDSEGDRSVFRNIFNSTAFGQLMQNHSAKVLALSRTESLSSSEKMRACISLRYLRVLGGVVDVSPAVAVKILSEKYESIGKSLVEVVSRILSTLENGRDSDLVEFCADSTLITRLNIATGCLSVVQSILRYERANFTAAQSALSEIVAGDSRLLEKLACFLFDWAEKLMAAREIVKFEPRGQFAFLVFTSIAMDLLTAEISWAQTTAATITSDLPIVRAVENCLRGRLSRIVDVTKEFITIDGLSSFTSAYASFSAGVTIDLFCPSISNIAWFLNVMAGPSSYLGGRDFFVTSNGYDSRAASQWFNSLSDADASEQYFTVDLFSTYMVLSDELRCLSSFKFFAHVLNLLLGRWRNDSPDSSVLARSQYDFAASMSREVLTAMHKNLAVVEYAQLEVCQTLLTSEALYMAKALAGLVLAYISTKELAQNFPSNVRIEAMERLAEISKMVYRVAQMQSKEYFLTMKHLFLTSTVLTNTDLRRDYTSQDFELRSRVSNIYVDLVSTACKVIRDMDQVSLMRKDYKSCFIACVALLAAITETVGSDYNYSSRMCTVFKESDLIRSLVILAGLYGSMQEDDRHETELAVLGLFTMMAATGEPNMLLLLASNDTLLTLSSHHTVKFVSGVDPLRGSTTNNLVSTANSYPAGFVGYDDSSSMVWRASMKLIVACLLSSSRNARTEEETARRFQKLAINFLQENKDSVLSCLKQSSSVGYGPKASYDHYLTLNGLCAAKLVLSIVSGAVDAIQRECPSLFDALKGQSLALVVGLTTFLGSTSAAREIFSVLAEFENAEDTMIVDQGPQFARLSPVYRLLAGGIQNATHEAIRYSNFVSASSIAITSAEKDFQQSFPSRWKSVSQTQPPNGSMSMSSLEEKCRSGVTNKFSFRLEHEAAECLFVATSILWKTHPASSSFVMFTEEEARRLDAMRLVAPGMVIAFRNDKIGLGRNPFGGVFGLSDQDTNKLHFARVLRVDTINRRWYTYTEPVDPAVREEYCVQESQLAGIEDTTKRMCILSHAAAPESSSGLEDLCRSVSVGHLLFALRWCSEFQTETRDDELSDEDLLAVGRLAELLSAFVGLELSIYQENNSRPDFSAIDANSKQLADQVLDLFGEASEFGPSPSAVDVVGNTSGRREGKLRPLLSKETWDGVRRQLRFYLDLAVAELTAKLRSERKRPEAGSLFLRRSSSGSSSPFRGIGI